MNASDVRSGQDLVSIIKNALEMNSIEMDGRTNENPTCLILDEIDGALGGEEGD